jgi:thiol-disulfide isomerase/thioredoxin
LNLGGRIALVAAAGLAGGLLLGWWLYSAPPQRETVTTAAPAAIVGERRPDFRHAGIDGRYWEAADFDGAPVLVNFWATWCAPCLREMPLLERLDDEYGDRLQVVGIAVDRPGAVRPFVERLEVDYPILIGTSDVRETQERFGNPGGMLPYTVLVDAGGVIRWRHLGEVDRRDIERALGAAGRSGEHERPRT